MLMDLFRDLMRPIPQLSPNVASGRRANATPALASVGEDTRVATDSRVETDATPFDTLRSREPAPAMQATDRSGLLVQPCPACWVPPLVETSQGSPMALQALRASARL